MASKKIYGWKAYLATTDKTFSQNSIEVTIIYYRVQIIEWKFFTPFDFVNLLFYASKSSLLPYTRAMTNYIKSFTAARSASYMTSLQVDSFGLFLLSIYLRLNLKKSTTASLNICSSKWSSPFTIFFMSVSIFIEVRWWTCYSTSKSVIRINQRQNTSIN